MTAKQALPPTAPKITLDDVKHRAEAVKDLAVSDAKSALATVARTEESKKLLIAVGVVIAVASVAYYLGSRAARGHLEDII